MAFESTPRTHVEDIADRQKGRNLPAPVWAAIVVCGVVWSLITGVPVDNPVNDALDNYAIAIVKQGERDAAWREAQEAERDYKRALARWRIDSNVKAGISDPDGDGSP